MSVLAWVLSIWGNQLLDFIPVVKEISNGVSTVWGSSSLTIAGAAIVYRLMLVLALFHLVMALLTLGVTNSADPRAMIQDGFWFVKVFVIILLTVGAFFVSNTVLNALGWVALIGAAFFILIQLLLLVDFAHSWNTSWVQKAENNGGDERWFYALAGSSVVMYLFALALTIVMYVIFCKGDGCGVNIFFVTFNLIMCIICTIASVSPRVQEANPTSGLLQSALVTAYATYMVFSAISSEGTSMPCAHSLTSSESVNQSSFILGALFTIVTVCYSAIRMSSSSDALTGNTTDSTALVSHDDGESGAPADEEVEGVHYSYSFFHLTFCMASMYTMMLLTNWQVLHANDGGLEPNSGTGAVWVKMVSSWLTLILYIWTLVAPICMPDREF